MNGLRALGLIQGLGLRVEGFGFIQEGLGCRFQGFGFEVYLGFRV